MNTNIKIFLLCPVPDEQKPITEYISLKENPLTNWTTLSKIKYQNKLLKFLLYNFIFIGFFTVNNILSDINNLIDWFFINTLISLNLLLFLLLIVIFRWKQTQNRFKQTRLIYEEGSWYDSQIWEKPFLIIKNDKLISTQKIEPIVQRLSQTFFFFFGIDIIFLILFQI